MGILNFRVRSDSAQRFMTIDETTETFFSQFKTYTVENLGDAIIIHLHTDTKPGAIKVSNFPPVVPYLRFGQQRWFNRILKDGVTLLMGETVEESPTHTKLVLDFTDIEYAMRAPSTSEKLEFDVFDRAHSNYYAEVDKQERIERTQNRNNAVLNYGAPKSPLHTVLELIEKSGFTVLDGQLTLEGKDGSQLTISMKK